MTDRPTHNPDGCMTPWNHENAAESVMDAAMEAGAALETLTADEALSIPARLHPPLKRLRDAVRGYEDAEDPDHPDPSAEMAEAEARADRFEDR